MKPLCHKPSINKVKLMENSLLQPSQIILIISTLIEGSFGNHEDVPWILSTFSKHGTIVHHNDTTGVPLQLDCVPLQPDDQPQQQLIAEYIVSVGKWNR